MLISPAQIVTSLIPLAYLVVAGYYDYISHRQIVPVLLFGGAAIGAIIFRRAVYSAMQPLKQFIPERFFPLVLVGVPGIIYFVTRGSGTLSSSGSLILILMVGAFAALVISRGAAIDEALSSWYSFRNGLMPRPVRFVAPILLGIFFSFAIAHGSLADVGALFGGSTSSPSTPSTSKILFATILTVVGTFLLVRDAPERERSQ